ncbi:F1F0-ATP synthase inhibitor [Komagataella phaffii CBS 7435]|uniref:ATPase inhibitor, mitochondrial n=2 Tax=Komagataella phaffii TaxID=460519 RepID=C4QWR9_KOMPG|nr:Protein that inhibits ATP hydrolysis by the F1F0-ATP synthase [Komagataella phaffii GS115]KAI0464922.1 hypothetical protein LJB42_000137 [Komagataella kurtzmanii]CAH2446467.1 F1F0-ATP synthase inhibitor [Komagataella phaffii CBS 7435]CAY67692.1 Protein that inhibits ATP hydrolysis by the F1F0-ATP synthase [Komagataella phaffii GS115]CCA36784.1 F1F0-ATP synthase inhibitor [Komagataella phaffii CBS 7435]
MFQRTTATLVRQNKAIARFYSEGSTGAPRSDGSGDAFTKREKAQEDFYIKKHQAEQLAKLREQLKNQKEHLQNLEKEINNIKEK